MATQFHGHPLVGMLAIAVSNEIDKLREVDDELRATQIAHHTRGEIATLVGTHGDDLLFGGEHCVETFAATARALACLAFQPGGVTVFGLHFCVDHDACIKADAAATASGIGVSEAGIRQAVARPT